MTITTGVAITNPLVLYRSWVSLGRLRPDPAQHRLAIHLQKLYDRLKDYSPTEEYSHKLTQLNRILNEPGSSTPQDGPAKSRRGPGLWKSLLAEKQRRETLAITRSLTDHDAAMEVTSPQGLLVHGEVGNGKSTLIDLFAECLPTQRKKRYHYSTFMLDVLSRLEFLRRQRVQTTGGLASDQHSLLRLARELISTSPVLFLDEFQLPDRMAAKTLSGLLTAFFRLGGVLIATSNRLPDELAKAAGMGYASAPAPGVGRGMKVQQGGKSGGMFAGLGEFSEFLDLLKTRCEVWEMESSSDYRRDGEVRIQSLIEESEGGVNESVSKEGNQEGLATDIGKSSSGMPLHYSVSQSVLPVEPKTQVEVNEVISSLLSTITVSQEVDWSASTAIVYGRTIEIPRTMGHMSAWTFNEICGKELGPADYITLASRFHTFIITDIPILTSALKNEARRFITLLDALYEARCKLAVSAAAAPDDLFFPELKATRKEARTSATGAQQQETIDEDSIHAEVFAEIHQDLTSPFRPNISSYYQSSSPLPADALEDDPPNRIRRHAPALQGMSEAERMETLGQRTPNFALTTQFVGEDEKFAYKRATSRLWEMCGTRWWARTDEGWWKPVGREIRHWERRSEVLKVKEKEEGTVPVLDSTSVTDAVVGGWREVSESEDEVLFRHGGSPFRTSQEAPPKIQPEHVWGVQKWGKKAGAWGQGVEGLKERKKTDR